MTTLEVKANSDSIEAIPHRTAIQAASACNEIACSFFNSLSTNKVTAGHQMFRSMGELIAAATNLALSLELALKALYLVIFKTSSGHNLLDLYADLPEDLQSTIAENYQKACKIEGSKHTNALALEMSGVNHSERLDINKKLKSKLDFNYIKSVLSSAKNIYVSWRYIYESNESPELYPLPYGAMLEIFNILRFHVLDIEQQVNEQRIKK